MPTSNAQKRLEEALKRHRSGDAHGAEKTYLELLAEDPDYGEAHFLLGVVASQKNLPDEAVSRFRKAISCSGATAKYHLFLGNTLLKQGDAHHALLSFQSALDLDENNPSVHHGIGVSLSTLNRFDEAVSALERARKINPSDSAIYTDLGIALGRSGQMNKGRALLDVAIEKFGKEPSLTVNRARILLALGEVEQAFSEVKATLSQASTHPQARLLHAECLQRMDRHEEAKLAFEELLADGLPEDDHPGALLNLGAIRTRLKEYPEAYDAFTRANEKLRQRPEWRLKSSDRYLARVRKNRAWFSKKRFDELMRPEIKDSRELPIFFVGFPRSGTTLMEQVFKAHPRVKTTDEISPLAHIRETLVQTFGGEENYPSCLAKLSPGQISELRDLFWQDAERLVGDLAGQVLFDKLPLNITELGLLGTLFPQAKVLVALRDPRDVCLSNYMQNFGASDAMASSLDIGQCGKAYAEVMGLWLHYRQIIPNPWLEYKYEDLVQDFEATVRKSFAFVGLPWTDDILNYREKTKGREIGTPSQKDVRSKIFSRASGRWRRFAVELKPIKENVEPFVSVFGYEPWSQP